MNYTASYVRNSSADFVDLLVIPNPFEDYVNSGTVIESTSTGREAYCFHGDLYYDEEDYVCEECHCYMNRHDTYHVRLRHVCMGEKLTYVMVDKHRFMCPQCGHYKMQQIPFQADGHHITNELLTQVESMLSNGFTNKQISGLTGLHQATIKDIDKARLKRLYTEDGVTLKKPEKQARYLAIDEFKLHDGYQFATHIIDLESGHVLWIQKGKKKQVVYDFIQFVGDDWMSKVEAVACDMNSDFQEAFEEKCPDIQIVYDHFHLIKNFNEKVVTEVRKDEQNRLIREGKTQAAQSLKGSRYILMSKRETLQKKDTDARERKITQCAVPLFGVPEQRQLGENEHRYNRLLAENKLFCAIDIEKELLHDAFDASSDAEMADKMDYIMDVCNGTENSHFKWFARLILNHYEGIIAHGSIRISSGKIEGINNKIKVQRRQAYGYNDDEYFFLKILDASRRCYERTLSSPKLLH